MDSEAADDAAPSVQKLLSLLSKLEDLTSGANKGGSQCSDEQPTTPAVGLLVQAKPACKQCLAVPDPQTAAQEGRPGREADGRAGLSEGRDSQLWPDTGAAQGCAEQLQQQVKEQRQQLARLRWELHQREEAAAAAEAEGAHWREECTRRQRQLQAFQSQLPPIVRKVGLLGRLVSGSAAQEPESISRGWADAGTQTEVAPASVQVLEQQGGSSMASLQQQFEQTSRRVAELEEQGRRREQEWLARVQGYEDQLQQLREELAAQRGRQAQQGPAQYRSSGPCSSLDQAAEVQLGAAAAGHVEEMQWRQQDMFSERQEARRPAADQVPAQQEPRPAAIPAAAAAPSASAPEQPLAWGPGQQHQQRSRDEDACQKRQRLEHSSATAALDTVGGSCKGRLQSGEREATCLKRKAEVEQTAIRAEAARAEEAEDGELASEAARVPQRKLEQPSTKKHKGMSGGPIAAGRPIPRTVFVKSLPFEAERADLRHFFRDCGKITKITIGADRKTGRSRGFAFVEFGTEGEAARAAQLHGARLLGRAVGVCPALEPSAEEPNIRPLPRVRTCLFVKGFWRQQEATAVEAALTKAFSRYGEVVRLYVVAGDGMYKLAGHAFLDLLTDNPEAAFDLNGTFCAGGSLIVERNYRPEKTRGSRGRPTGLRRAL